MQLPMPPPQELDEHVPEQLLYPAEHVLLATQVPSPPS
jgi:hypothetical protein